MKSVHAILLSLLFSICCYAGDGTLDPLFGSGAGFVDTPNGVVTTRIGVQTDGKIVALGAAVSDGQIVRYNSDGTLDTTFGVGGVVSLTSANFFLFDLVIQADGNIVIAGTDVSNGNFLLIRYLTNGSLDTTFQINGISEGPNGFAMAVALQADSKIVAAGSDGIDSFRVVRYNSNGTIDTTFQSGPDGRAESIVIQPDGKSVVAGESMVGNVAVARYNTDGTLDATFGIGGIATAPSGNVTDVLLQSDGNIVVTGYESAISSNFQLVRFTPAGILDVTFGTGGVATAFPNSTGNDAVLQSDGKIVVTGLDNTVNVFKLARFTTTGNPDITFGTGGLTLTPNGVLSTGGASQADGKVLLLGIDSGSTNFQVARYISSPILTPTTITFPRNGSIFAKNATVSFRGAAQGQSMVYLFLDGVLVAGTATDPVTNTWTISQTVSINSGSHTAYAVAVYGNGNVDILSAPVVFTVQSGCC